ncbi:sugar ABC transporter substrate-binding protein [Clostridium intestinale]|uniref:sugar ABC transporter substrate-binding protein n=1 Tax=Clostridium intestinale TaxID=36845 RepID=UPI002DD64524|nr:substrate-binding domain-containing protein [Clostridium intestinale]WRY52677.1 substrate-binding domain-containing protein [Clostridium intestinale]
MYLSIPKVFLVPVSYTEIIMFKEELYEHNPMDRENIVIGVSLPNQRIPRWIRDKEAFKYYTDQKGVTLKLEDADYDPLLQTKQVEDLISQNVDVLIIAPLDSLAFASLVKKAKEAGIKVISYDGLLQNSNSDLYISYNGTQVGELQGKYLVQNVPKGNYIILSGDPNDDTSKLYKDGSMLYIIPLVATGSIKIVSSVSIPNWNPVESYNVIKTILSKNNNINAILSPTDAISGGAIKALEEAGLAGKVAITGQDASPAAIKRIIAGTQSMTVLKDSRELAKVAVNASIKLVNGESLDTNAIINNGFKDVPAIILPPTLVTRYNIPETIINTGFLSPNDIYS